MNGKHAAVNKWTASDFTSHMQNSRQGITASYSLFVHIFTSGKQTALSQNSMRLKNTSMK